MKRFGFSQKVYLFKTKLFIPPFVDNISRLIFFLSIFFSCLPFVCGG